MMIEKPVACGDGHRDRIDLACLMRAKMGESRSRRDSPLKALLRRAPQGTSRR